VGFVSRLQNTNNLIKAELTEKVSVFTNISIENHAALRAGFSGFPANPRWNISKFRAWKTGRQWRNALACGQMMVRSNDSMLVTATEKESQEEPPSSSLSSKSIISKSFQFAIGKQKSQTPYQVV
jgi:hypothetical protein